MLNFFLTILGIGYIVINLVLFGTALVIFNLKESLEYLFFGVFILIKELIIDPWKN